VKQAILQYG